jgi:hypothetical protein
MCAFREISGEVEYTADLLAAVARVTHSTSP